jgi:membrane associated rhomboid family serine protease
MFPLKDDIPGRRFPLVTLALIAVNVLAFVLWRDGGTCDVVDYAVVPAELTGDAGRGSCTSAPTWLTPLTAMFTHDGILHLAGDLLFLWLFGRTVETALGRVRFLAFYVLAGLAATALLVALGPESDVPSIGAAGAISGVVGAYLMLFPRARVISLAFLLFFVTIVAVPALVYAGAWVAEQVLFDVLDVTSIGATGGSSSLTVAGGLAFGLLAMKLLAGRLGTDRVPA